MQLDALYRQRFDSDARAAKQGVWQVLCQQFLQRYVPEGATVLDVGAGQCEFINHVRAARRIAVDANPDLPGFAAPGVETQCTRAEQLSFLPDASVDVAFSSNFFEHLPDKAALVAVVQEIRRVVRPGGKVLVMGPNVRLLPGTYWDYFDHHIPLTDRSVVELLEMVGLQVRENIPRFMPYTVKGALPTWSWLVRAYLAAAPLSFAVLGKQFLVVAERTP